MRRALRRARGRLHAPRRLRVLRPGGFVILGTFALGLATLNTGNNLLYLMLGALLGTIALSGWLSEQVMRSVRITRLLPRSITAGTTARIEYQVHNTSADPLYALRVQERLPSAGARGLVTGAAVVPVAAAGATVRAWGALTAQRRGAYVLDRIAFGTAYPFGLFLKERDIVTPATLLVWPRTDRKVRAVVGGTHAGLRSAAVARAAPGAARGDFRGLREYRPGDDPRDLHWRSTARRGSPIIREYDRRVADEYWIVLDTVASDAAAGEVAIEMAAALLVQAAARGQRAGLAAGVVRLEPREGAVSVEAALDVLAAVRLLPAGPAPQAPAPREACVLVTARGTAEPDWADVYSAQAES